MRIKTEVKHHQLHFKFEAGTSRGVMKTRDSWIIKFTNLENGSIGFGECAPLAGLSKEFISVENYQNTIKSFLKEIDTLESCESFLKSDLARSIPSIKFGIETAFYDLQSSFPFEIIENNPFFRGQPIPINGLIWMGDTGFMKSQIEQKIKQNYKCIKLKIGALDFDTEFEILKSLRSKFPKELMEIRVDANGAYNQNDVFKNLEKLATLNIHSIEQPVKAGDVNLMKACVDAKILPIALDEELFGIYKSAEQKNLLETIKPDYLVLKPGLLGGFSQTNEWISLAERFSIKWWITSALESSVGLNAIAQFTSTFKLTEYQGLGTGQLFTNNFESPLMVNNGFLSYDPQKKWKINV